jgi:hypothetical protein
MDRPGESGDSVLLGLRPCRRGRFCDRSGTVRVLGNPTTPGSQANRLATASPTNEGYQGGTSQVLLLPCESSCAKSTVVCVDWMEETALGRKARTAWNSHRWAM